MCCSNTLFLTVCSFISILHCLTSLDIASGTYKDRVTFLSWPDLDIQNTASLKSATLKLRRRTLKGSPLQVNMNACDSAFVQTSLTWNNRPQDCFTSVLDYDAIALQRVNGFHEFDLLPYLQSKSQITGLTISLSTTDSALVKYSSEIRGDSERPQLILET